MGQKCVTEMTFQSAILAVLLLLSGCAEGQECSKSDRVRNKESMLASELLCNYDIEQRPVKNSSNTITVKMSLIPLYIRTGDQNYGEEYVTISSWLLLNWKDEYLNWKEKQDYQDVEMLRISSDRIWTPNLGLFSELRHPNSMLEFVTECIVWHDSVVECVPHASHVAVCKSELVRWPYDTQNCTLTFRAWIRYLKTVNLTYEEAHNTGKPVVQMTYYEKNHYWSLENMEITRRVAGVLEYESVSLQYSFILKRHSAKYDAFIVGPAIAMVCMTMVSIMLAVDSVDRVYLLGLSILSHFIYLQQLSWWIPSNGDECPLIILYFRDSMIVTACVLLVTSVLRLNRVWPNKCTDTVAKILFTAPGKIFMFKGFEQSDFNVIIGESTSEANRETIPEVDHINTKKCDLVTIFANRILFLLTSVTYFGLYLALLIRIR